MRIVSTTAILFLATGLIACGAKSTSPPPAEANANQSKEAPDTLPGHTIPEAMAKMPKDEVHKGLATSPHGEEAGPSGSMGMSGAMNTEIHLDKAIRAAWSGVKIQVADRKTGASKTYDVPLGKPTALGATGLTLTADAFIPDFVMGADGIASRSANPKNTAAHVTISEKGKPDYKGWLFGEMPDIHPFPHDVYEVTLVSGIPAKR